MDRRVTAYTVIREMILGGDLPVGERTSERKIAEDIGLSRTPVREALAVLVATGMLDQVPQVGVVVRQIESEEALRIVRLRMGMETVMVDELAGLSDVEFRHLEHALELMHIASKEHKEGQFMRADTWFHTELAQLGGFSSSVTGLQGMCDRIHLFRLRYPLSRQQMKDILGEDEGILSKIKTRQGDQAVEALRSHLEATRQRIEEVQADINTN